ncbi:D-alanyl-D-alanine carboxypeptidase [Candidatus Parcubacteria bacterium]|nr:D-alanyl-D-alanine carboxypeptidase [Candidatus Parcubacteria bacterium]
MWSRLSLAIGIVFVSAATFFVDYNPPARLWPREFIAGALESHRLPMAQPGQDVFLLASTTPDLAPVRDWSVPAFETTARAAAAVVLAGDGIPTERLLYQKGLLERVPIASITKLMTAVAVLDASADRNLREVVVVSRRAAETDGQKADLFMGEQVSASTLFDLMLVVSANDAAMALAEHVGKRIAEPGEDALQAFIRAMSIRAQELGLTDTSFANPSGLDDLNFSTAADLVALVKATRAYPEIWVALGKHSVMFVNHAGRLRTLKTTNELLGVLPGLEGGKTGFTAQAGESMVAISKIGPKPVRVVTVILASPDRFGETRRLVEWLQLAYHW